ncbi:uncharacterized protein LOC141877780 [Acropora palmata]|uniref:uncharacterized protein LOC141877780 n=1 Tax=Acropora palmata TaxID=6131 RepID=UPI003DA1690F
MNFDGIYDFCKALLEGYNNKLYFEHIAVQDDSGSDDSEVANPVERDRHGDANNYNSSEDDGSDIITVASDNEENIGDQHLDISSDEEGPERPAFNSTPQHSSRYGNRAIHTLSGTSLSGDTEVFVNSLYDSVICSRERAEPCNFLNACEVGTVQELADHLLIAETDPHSGPAHDTRFLQSLLAAHQVPQRLPFLCLEAAQMRLQSHEDMRPVLIIRYRPSEHAIAVLRLIMQSDECTKVLNHLNIHVALVGSSFDDKAIGKQSKKCGDIQDIELRILHPTMSPRQLVIGNILSGGDKNLISSLVSSAEEACQAANALASHRALIQEERELKRRQEEDLHLSEFQDRQRQCQEASNQVPLYHYDSNTT